MIYNQSWDDQYLSLHVTTAEAFYCSSTLAVFYHPDNTFIALTTSLEILKLPTSVLSGALFSSSSQLERNGHHHGPHQRLILIIQSGPFFSWHQSWKAERIFPNKRQQSILNMVS